MAPKATTKPVKRGRGRPRVADPKVSSHVPLTNSQRELCNAAAAKAGAPFSVWARMRLLSAAISELGASADTAASKST